MRTLMIVVLALTVGVAQDRKQDSKPCDLKQVVDGSWCPKCEKLLAKEDIDKGKCKKDSSDLEKVKVCEKDWVPSCSMHGNKPHEKDCCTAKGCCKIETVRCRVGFKCTGCGAWALTEDKVKHTEDKHTKKVVKACEKSGEFPHGGALK